MKYTQASSILTESKSYCNNKILDEFCSKMQKSAKNFAQSEMNHVDSAEFFIKTKFFLWSRICLECMLEEIRVARSSSVKNGKLTKKADNDTLKKGKKSGK